MIKRFIKLLLCLCLFVMPAYAVEISPYCAQPYDMSMKGTQVITNITGMTFLSQAVANSIVKNELKKATGSKGFKVKMKSFSAKDLADGRFKSLSITGDNLDFDGVYVSEFRANTVCDFNYIKATSKTVTFKENFLMDYSILLTENDLRKTILSEDYMKFLKSLNKKVKGLNLLELKKVDLRLHDDKVVYILNFDNKIMKYSIPFNISVSSRMKVENGRIKTTEVAFDNLNGKLNLTQLTNILNYINPLSFTVDVMGNKDTKLSLTDLNIKEGKLMLAGSVFVPKNTKEGRE